MSAKLTTTRRPREDDCDDLNDTMSSKKIKKTSVFELFVMKVLKDDESKDVKKRKRLNGKSCNVKYELKSFVWRGMSR